MYAGINVCGTKAEEMLGTDLWMARYILERVIEDFGASASRPIMAGDYIKQFASRLTDVAMEGLWRPLATENMELKVRLKLLEDSLARLQQQSNTHEEDKETKYDSWNNCLSHLLLVCLLLIVGLNALQLVYYYYYWHEECRPPC